MPNGPQKSYVSRIEQASGIQVWRQTGVFAHDDLSAAECRCDMSGYAYRPMKLSIFLQGLRAVPGSCSHSMGWRPMAGETSPSARGQFTYAADLFGTQYERALCAKAAVCLRLIASCQVNAGRTSYRYFASVLDWISPSGLVNQTELHYAQRCLSREPAAIHGKDDAVHISGSVRREKHRRAADFFRPAPMASRDSGENGPAARLVGA